MPDPIARKRLKKKMLDRWENEGGAIGRDTPTADDRCLTSEDKAQEEKLSSQGGKSTVGASESSKRAKPTRK